MTFDSYLLLLPMFFLVAALYASVGHGGASGYLALFALFGIATPSVAPIVLVLNIIAATTGFINYYRAGHFQWKLLLPFVVGSIPAAFIGGYIALSATIFAFILGVALLLAAARIFFLGTITEKSIRDASSTLWFAGLPIGIVLGLISGMIGIGGGVFLSPILLFLRWADAKKTAAVSGAFIVLNSLSGLSGHISRGNFSLEHSTYFFIVVFLGALVGSRYSTRRISSKHLQWLLAVVMVFAGIKLLSKFFL